MKKNVVVQNNHFIRNILYLNKLNTIEIKVFKSLISKIKNNETLFDDFYEIDYTTLDIAGVDKQNRFQRVYQALDNLLGVKITLTQEMREKTNDKDLIKRPGNKRLTLIRNFTYEKNKSKMSVEIDNSLKPFLLELERNYTIYDLENISRLKMVKDIKVYEIMKSWLKNGTVTYSIKQLNEILEIEKDYRYLKNKTLIPIINRINKNTDLVIEFKELNSVDDIIPEKRKQKVHKLIFYINDKNSLWNNKVKDLENKTFLDKENKKFYIKKIIQNKDLFDLEFIDLQDGGKGTIKNMNKEYIINEIFPRIKD